MLKTGASKKTMPRCPDAMLGREIVGADFMASGHGDGENTAAPVQMECQKIKKQ